MALKNTDNSKQTVKNNNIYNTDIQQGDSINNTIPSKNAQAAAVEVVETANKELLQDKIRARAYFKHLAEKIIEEQDIQYQATPKDKDKIYPRLDVFGWGLVLDFIQLYNERDGLLLSGDKRIDSYKYNYNNVLCMTDVYIFLCAVYGFIPCGDDLLKITGIDRDVFLRWASSGYTDLIKKVDEIGKSAFVKTFLNSKVPIERIYTANNLYQLDETPEKADVLQLETLPDLKQLTAQNGIVPLLDTIQADAIQAENP